MSKLIRTNERCYICDFGRAVEEDTIGTNAPAGALQSYYLDGMTNGSDKLGQEYYHKYQDDGHRYVFVDPRDGKPVCTHCAAEAQISVEELEYIDRDFNPKTWDEESVESWQSQTALGFEETTIEHVQNETKIVGTDQGAFEITDEHRKQIDKIRREKGYLKSPKDEDKLREARNARLDEAWQPLPEKPRLPKTSEWPYKNSDDSQGSMSKVPVPGS